MYRTLSALAAVAVTIGAFSLTAPAEAASIEDGITVSLAGLDPADPGDADRIDRRIRNAARDLCGSQMLQPVRMMQQAAACEKAALAEGRAAAELAAARQGATFRLALRSR